jgi:hypothetical protein
MAAVLFGDTGEQLGLKDGDEEPMLLKLCHRQFLQSLLYFPNRMTYTVVCGSDGAGDGRVDTCSGSIRKVDVYRTATTAFLKSKALKAFPCVIEGERFEREERDERDDAADEDSFVGTATTAVAKEERRSGSLGGGEPHDGHTLTTAGASKHRFDMYTALNEVGWRRRDVLGYGHDQLLQDPVWWFTFDQSGRNVVVDNLVQEFLVARGDEDDENEYQDGGDDGADDYDFDSVGGGSAGLVMHPKTKLYYFKN